LFCRFASGNITLNACILAACQAVGLALTTAAKPSEKEITLSDQVSYASIFRNKSFLLYFVPWLMFSFINFLINPVVSGTFPSLFQFSGLVEVVLGGVLSLVFGFYADRIGRKRLVVAGFVLLGLGYAGLGLSPTESVWGWWFYTTVDGIAWGHCTWFF
jgi:MFS family permease